MDEQPDQPRLTRATRSRMSISESRPSTPLVDLTSDRVASPRPLTRARRNSVTAELKTPTRVTRASTARSQTPDPISISSKKQGTVSPVESSLAKRASARKQLPLMEQSPPEAKATGITTRRTSVARGGTPDTTSSATRLRRVQVKLAEIEENAMPKSAARGSRASSMASEDSPEQSSQPYTPRTNRATRAAARGSPKQLPLEEQNEEEEELKKEVEVSVTSTTSANVAVTSVTVENISTKSSSSDSSAITVVSQSLSYTEKVDTPKSNSKEPQAELVESAIEVVEKEAIASVDCSVIESSPQKSDETNRTTQSTSTVSSSSTVRLSLSCTDQMESLEVKSVELKEELIDSAKEEETSLQKSDDTEPTPTAKTESSKSPESDHNINNVNESHQKSDPMKQSPKKVEIDYVSLVGEGPSTKSNEGSIEIDAPPVVSKALQEDKSNDFTTADESKEEGEISIDDSGEISIKHVDNDQEHVKNSEISVIEVMDISTDGDIDVFDEAMEPLVSVQSPAVASKLSKIASPLPDLKRKSLVRETEKKPQAENSKTVAFQDDVKEPSSKMDYRKTPARTVMPPVLNIVFAGSGTPEMLLKGRHSSTPVAKRELLIEDPKPAPPQIDVIQSLEEDEVKVADTPVKNKPTKEVHLENEEDAEEVDESEGEDEQDHCEFVDNEAEVVHNYESGDSMNSSERHEIEENAIPEDGESIGSLDTSEDEDDGSSEDLSFVVTDESCELLNEDDEEEQLEDNKSAKAKRKRIIIASSSEDSNDVAEVFLDAEDNHDKDAGDKAATANDNSDEKQLDNEADKSLKKTEVEAEKDESSNEEGESISKQQNKDVVDKLSLVSDADVPPEEVVNINKSMMESMDIDMEAETKDSSTVEPKESVDNADNVEKDEKVTKIIPESVKKSPSAASTAFPGVQMSEDEAALLADLSHLQPMFNPLQKSRRQTLFVEGTQMANDEPKSKLKRRSEHITSEVNPSQSFIESLDEKVSQLSKRKRLSKSFSVVEMESKMSVDHSEPELATADQNETKNESIKMQPSPAKVTKASPEMPSSSHNKKKPSPAKVEKQAKSQDYYLDYCDAILQAANEAKLKEKQQRNAAGKKPKKLRPDPKPTAEKPLPNKPADVPVIVKPQKKVKPKKDLKRLQATTQAVKQAMQLLVPESKQPQSLARKLSPNPETRVTKDMKLKKKKKPKIVLNSPNKSSDEENRVFHNNAGIVKVSSTRKFIKTAAGIVTVEPGTPHHKYSKRIPVVQSNTNFVEMPQSPKPKAASMKLNFEQRNAATVSAQNFKMSMLSKK